MYVDWAWSVQDWALAEGEFTSAGAGEGTAWLRTACARSAKRADRKTLLWSAVMRDISMYKNKYFE
jgi:hypothetical protein